MGKQNTISVVVKLRDEALQLVIDEKKKFTLRKLVISKETIINNILIDEYKRRNPLKQDLL